MSQLMIELRPGEGGDDAYAFCLELKAAVVAYARRRGDALSQMKPDPAVVPSNSPWREIVAPMNVWLVCTGCSGSPRMTAAAVVTPRLRRLPSSSDSPRRVVEIADEDVDVFTYRGSGKGGQHRNKTDSAVRVVHRPTGTVVVVEHGRSQWQNLQQAKLVLGQRLQELARRADSTKGLPPEIARLHRASGR